MHYQKVKKKEHELVPMTSYAGFGESTYKPSSVIIRSCLQHSQQRHQTPATDNKFCCSCSGALVMRYRSYSNANYRPQQR